MIKSFFGHYDLSKGEDGTVSLVGVMGFQSGVLERVFRDDDKCIVESQEEAEEQT